MPSRRQLLGSIAGLTAAGGFIATTSQPSKAEVSLAGLDIPDNTTQVKNGIEDIQLSVSGDYTISMSKTPTRVIIRVKVTHNNKTSQIAATETRDYSKEMNGGYALNGSILDHPEIDRQMLFPEQRGEQSQVEFDVTVQLQVKHNQRMVGTADASETTTLTTKRTKLSVEAQITGSGSTRVITRTPS